MSRRNKLLKFTENLTFHNVYESFTYGSDILVGANGADVVMTGQWHKQHFNNSNPLTLELACGRGEYCLGLATRHPDRNFIGVDIKGARIWRGAVNAIDQKLDNVAFLRTKIESLDKFFEPGEISSIWITFPDPFLKEGKINRRLTSPNFLNMYKRLLPKDHSIHLKTDSPEFYEHTKEMIQQEGHQLLADSADIYKGALPHPDLDILTFYERSHLKDKRLIKYVEFRLV